MTEVTVYTKEQQDEVETIFTLLAGSNRWPHYVGLMRNVEKIDNLIEQGKIVQAAGHLQMVSLNFLTFELASVAIGARQAYLDARDVEHPRPTSHLMDDKLTQAIGDLLEEQVFATAEELPLEGCPTDEEIQITGWSEGRGYGDFPKEGL